MRSIGLIFLLAPTFAMGLLFQVGTAHAQCAANDVAGNRRLLDDPALLQTPQAVQSAAGIPVWKTIQVGTVQAKWDLYRALDAARCELGDAAEDMFAQPAFAVSPGQIMRGHRSSALPLPQPRSGLNCGCNISSSRSGNFSTSQWRRSKRPTASRGFLSSAMAAPDSC
jgi:hypothetical protein